MPAAFSYLRFSSPQQATGDSIRRQIEAREQWLAAHPDASLDTSLRMTDAGRSGFRRKDWDTYALAQFIDHIKAKRVLPGSYLLVENLDRLSREGAGEATELFLSIVNKGVHVVQLSPAVMEFKKPVDMMSLMFAIVELSRGHSESAMKSERVGKAWARKQREAGTHVVTKRLPGWIKYDDDKLSLDLEKAEVVRRIFRLAIEGQGAMTIAKTFNAEKQAPLGRATMKGRPVAWANVTVAHILTSRATVGEYIPYATDRTKSAGAPIPNYFPAVIDERTYYAAQAAIGRRATVGRGRRGKHVNLFAGMMRDARDGGPMTYRHQAPHATIVPTNATQGRATFVSFPAVEFENEILSKLAELKAADVVGGNGATTEIASLSGEKESLEAVIRAWEQKMGDVKIVDRVAANLAKFSEQLDAVNAKLAEAQGKAASPVGEALGGLKTLADLLAKDNSDDMRLKVRGALRQCIESVHCLFGGTTAVRFAAVRVQFRDTDAHRDYVIVHYGAQADGTPARTEAKDFRLAGLPGLDLRKAADAKRLEKAIAKAVLVIRSH